MDKFRVTFFFFFFGGWKGGGGNEITEINSSAMNFQEKIYIIGNTRSIWEINKNKCFYLMFVTHKWQCWYQCLCQASISLKAHANL